MLRTLKVVCNLQNLAKLFYRRYHLMNNEAPVGTIKISDNLFYDFGGISPIEEGDKQIDDHDYCYKAIEVNASIDETNCGILGHYANLHI